MTDPQLAYDRDGIQIWHGDNAAVRPDPSEVDLLLTDPPYGINLDTDYSKFENPGRTYERVAGDDVPFDPSEWLVYPRVVLWGANHFCTSLPHPGRWLVWRKRGASPLMAAGELAWHNLGGRPLDYFETTLGLARQQDGYLHPTQKPVALMRWILERFTQPGDLVYDPFMGSGPVARACQELGRRYIGVELHRPYVDAAVTRLAALVLDVAPPAAPPAEDVPLFNEEATA